MTNQPPIVLLIEDDPADLALARVALAGCKFRHELEMISDGRQAQARLAGKAPYDKRVKPALVLLDLSVPYVSGIELLRGLKENPATRAIPVVVWSGTQNAKLIADAYACHANAFIKKPGDLDSIATALCSCVEFWLGLVALPST